MPAFKILFCLFSSMHSLQLELKPSKYLFLIYSVLHIGAILCVVFANLHYFWKASCFSIILINFAVFYFKSRRWTSILWDKKMGWELVNSGQKIGVRLKGDSIRTKWIIILNFRCKVFPYFYSYIIFPDTISRCNFRRLQMVLLTQPWEDA
jgi:hypothetical protein